MQQQLLTTKDIADYLNVQVRTVRQWITDGKLAGIKLPNGDYRFKPEHLENWLKNKTVKTRVV